MSFYIHQKGKEERKKEQKKMKLPTKRGLATIPRYASGYMYQFGHIYLLQQELLNKRDADWFRALELWHTARHEGIALNVHHYNTILQHCAIESSSSSSSLTSNKKEQHSISTSEVGGGAASGAPWYVALNVLRQMKRDALRADCKTVSLALSVLANHGRWAEAMNTFSYFSGVNQNNNNNSIIQSDGGEISSSSSSLSKMNVGKFSGVGVKMDSVCVAAVIRACLNSSSTSTSTLQSEKEQVEEDGGKIKAEEFILSLRRLRNSSSNRRTSRAKSEPGKNPKFSSSSEQSSSTSATSTTTTISHSVDELTIQTALAELQAYFAAVRQEQQQHQQQMTLENQETETMTTMAITENHPREADQEAQQQQQQEQEDLETVPVYTNRNENSSVDDRRKKTLLENWGTFFEKVNEKSPKAIK